MGLRVQSKRLGGNETSSRLAAYAVSHYMRILVSVVEKMLVTAIPSEPILSIAAADIITKNLDIYVTKAGQTLLSGLIQQGLVLDTRDQGELCSRLLVLLTREMSAIKFHLRSSYRGRMMTNSILSR